MTPPSVHFSAHSKVVDTIPLPPSNPRALSDGFGISSPYLVCVPVEAERLLPTVPLPSPRIPERLPVEPAAIPLWLHAVQYGVGAPPSTPRLNWDVLSRVTQSHIIPSAGPEPKPITLPCRELIRCKEMRIRVNVSSTGIHYPWVIRVVASRDFVSVEDILRTLHAQFHTAATLQEVQMGWAQVGHVVSRRQQSMASRTAQPTVDFPVFRHDFLLGHTAFAGLHQLQEHKHSNEWVLEMRLPNSRPL